MKDIRKVISLITLLTRAINQGAQVACTNKYQVCKETGNVWYTITFTDEGSARKLLEYLDSKHWQLRRVDELVAVLSEKP